MVFISSLGLDYLILSSGCAFRLISVVKLIYLRRHLELRFLINGTSEKRLAHCNTIFYAILQYSELTREISHVDSVKHILSFNFVIHIFEKQISLEIFLLLK